MQFLTFYFYVVIRCYYVKQCAIKSFLIVIALDCAVVEIQ